MLFSNKCILAVQNGFFACMPICVPCAYSAHKSQKTASILDGNLKSAVDSGKLKVADAVRHFVYPSDRGLWRSRTANAFNH